MRTTRGLSLVAFVWVKPVAFNMPLLPFAIIGERFALLLGAAKYKAIGLSLALGKLALALLAELAEIDDVAHGT
jgi:hypothetical protein